MAAGRDFLDWHTNPPISHSVTASQAASSSPIGCCALFTVSQDLPLESYTSSESAVIWIIFLLLIIKNIWFKYVKYAHLHRCVNWLQRVKHFFQPFTCFYYPLFPVHRSNTLPTWGLVASSQWLSSAVAAFCSGSWSNSAWAGNSSPR